MHQSPYEHEHHNFRRRMVMHIGFSFSALTFLGSIPRHMISPMAPLMLTIISLCGFIFFWAGFLAYKKISPVASSTLLMLGIFGLGLNAGVGNGGMRAPISVVFVIIPLIGSMIIGNIGGYIGLLMSAVGISLVLGLEAAGLTLPLANPDKYVYYKGLIFLIIAFVNFIGGKIFERNRANSEEKLQEQNNYIAGIFDATSSAIFVTDDHGSITRTNEVGRTLLGLQPSNKILNQSFYSLFDNHCRPLVEELLDGVKDRKETVQINVQIVQVDLEKKWVQLHCRQLAQTKDRSEYLFTLLDISEEKLTTLLKSLNSLVMTGIAQKVSLEALGAQVLLEINLYDPSLTVVFSTPIPSARLHLRKENSAYITNNEVLIERTLQQLLALAEQNKNSESQIEAQKLMMLSSSKMAALGEMSAGVSHEINNPVFIILGKVAILKKQLEQNQISGEQLLKELTTIEKASERISTIVKGLRTFSRNSEQEPMYSFSFSSALHEVLCFYQEKFKFHHIRLIMDEESFKGVTFKGRVSQFEQVLVNLLNNSFDAVLSLDQKWVKIECQVELGIAKVSITDSGTGLSPEVQAKLMQPFFTTKEVGKGVGLSLSISKGIIEDHGGVLYYDKSSPHTKFTFQLPTLNKTEIKQSA